MFEDFACEAKNFGTLRRFRIFPFSCFFFNFNSFFLHVLIFSFFHFSISTFCFSILWFFFFKKRGFFFFFGRQKRNKNRRRCFFILFIFFVSPCFPFFFFFQKKKTCFFFFLISFFLFQIHFKISTRNVSSVVGAPRRWCPDDTGRDSWKWVGPPTEETA